MKKKYRVISHFRFSVFIVSVMVLIFFTTALAFGFEQPDNTANLPCTVIQIQAGDTMWDLAIEYGPDNHDIRKVVHAICKINGISPHELQPGQSILIPKYI